MRPVGIFHEPITTHDPYSHAHAGEEIGDSHQHDDPNGYGYIHAYRCSWCAVLRPEMAHRDLHTAGWSEEADSANALNGRAYTAEQYKSANL